MKDNHCCKCIFGPEKCDKYNVGQNSDGKLDMLCFKLNATKKYAEEELDSPYGIYSIEDVHEMWDFIINGDGETRTKEDRYKKMKDRYKEKMKKVKTTGTSFYY